jgi:Fanconi anemia group M protein
LAEDTRDEAYFWISKRREDEMEAELRKLKGVADEVEEELDDSQRRLGDFDTSESDDSDGERDVKPGLQEFDASDDEASDHEAGDDAESERVDGEEATDAQSQTETEEGVVATAEPDDETVEIVADQRELDSTIARDLSTREGIETRLETLSVGDYVLSDRVVVERKSVSDFLDTLVGGDRSMFEQVGDATRHYARPVVILEGEGLYEERNVHPNAIRGALSSLAVDFGASVLRTEDEDDTADLLEVVATREQEADDREVSVHGEKASKTLAEQQEYVVSSIADIGPVTARSLLEEFRTVEAVMTAREDDLLEVQGVGEVTAERIRDIIGSEYDR